MMIRYSILDRAFFLRDLGTGFGTFCKVEKPLVIQGNFLVSIGSCYLLVQEAQEEPLQGAFSDLTNFVKQTGSKTSLIIKVFGGLSHGKLFLLEPSKKP